MVAANKIEPGFNTQQHSTRLGRLLLDLNYKKQNLTVDNKSSIENNQSRIEAEYQMEEIFKCLF